MRFSKSSDRRRYGWFDMTPMIDVVMLLIIFFMFTAQASSVARSPVDLPRQPGEDAPDIAPGAVVIDVLADGTMRIDRRRVDLAGVAEAVRAASAKAGDPGAVKVLVRADRTIPAAIINDLARQLRAMGVGAWRLGTSEQGG